MTICLEVQRIKTFTRKKVTKRTNDRQYYNILVFAVTYGSCFKLFSVGYVLSVFCPPVSPASLHASRFCESVRIKYSLLYVKKDKGLAVRPAVSVCILYEEYVRSLRRILYAMYTFFCTSPHTQNTNIQTQPFAAA